MYHTIHLSFSVPPLLVFLGRPEETQKKHEIYYQNNHPPPKRHDNRDEGFPPQKSSTWKRNKLIWDGWGHTHQRKTRVRGTL